MSNTFYYNDITNISLNLRIFKNFYNIVDLLKKRVNTKFYISQISIFTYVE